MILNKKCGNNNKHYKETSKHRKQHKMKKLFQIN